MGICIGVTSVVIISCISSLGGSLLNDELDSLGMSGILVGCNNNVSTSLSKDDFTAITQVNAVKDATPVVVETTQAGNKLSSEQTMVWGIDTSANEVVSLELMYGRFFNETDISGNAKICIVDQAFAQTIYKRDNIVGKNITIQLGKSSDEYTVIGVIKTGSGILQSTMGNILPTFVYIPYTTVHQALGTNDFQQVITRVNDGEDVEVLSSTITKTLDRKNGTTDAYSVTNLSQYRDTLSDILSLVTLILTAIGAVSLVVASLSIMTVMLVSVNERTREIGIKKSIGATNRDIMKEFLTEAVLISLLGCVLGVIIGFGVSFAGARYFGLSLSADPSLILFSFVFSLATGVIFGVYPAHKASKLSPVEALRDE